MASLTRWTWVLANSRSWWWTGRPGVLQFMGSKRVGHGWATELNWSEGWDGWMVWLIQWTWVWASSRRWWRTGKPGVLQSMGSQIVRYDRATEQQQRWFDRAAECQLSTIYIFGMQALESFWYLLKLFPNIFIFLISFFSSNTLATWWRELTHWKNSDAGKDWRQEMKGMTEDVTVGWHHRLNGHESERTPGAGEGQGSLACCSPWGHKELDTT